MPNRFWSITRKSLLSFLIFSHCCMFCVDISCYCSIRWKITFKFKFDHKISENHKVTNNQICSVTNYLCTTVTQIIQEVQQHRLSKNYIVTKCVKTTVSISVRTIVSNSQNHTVTSSLRITMSWTMRSTVSQTMRSTMSQSI